jgi:glycosyltransferase involved in cell wall biosynthesis
MTAYNREKYIEEAINSVLQNSYKNFELIIIDDNSKDKTVFIVEKYLLVDNRIKLFKNKVNLGDYPNRNKAASYASGDFLMYVDSDDKLLPRTIETIIESVKDDDHFNFAMYFPHSTEKIILDGNIALHKHFFEKQFLYMGPGGTFIRKKYFDLIGCYPEKYGPANDMYFNLRACINSKIHLFPFEFIFYRIHDSQEINNNYSYLYNNYNYMMDALNHLQLPFSQWQISWLKKKTKRRFVVNTFSYYIKSKNIRKTLGALKKTNFRISDFLQGIFHFD